MKNEQIEILAGTLQALNQGSYEANGKTVRLQLSKQRMEASSGDSAARSEKPRPGRTVSI